MGGVTGVYGFGVLNQVPEFLPMLEKILQVGGSFVFSATSGLKGEFLKVHLEFAGRSLSV